MGEVQHVSIINMWKWSLWMWDDLEKVIIKIVILEWKWWYYFYDSIKNISTNNLELWKKTLSFKLLDSSLYVLKKWNISKYKSQMGLRRWTRIDTNTLSKSTSAAVTVAISHLSKRNLAFGSTAFTYFTWSHTCCASNILLNYIQQNDFHT